MKTHTTTKYYLHSLPSTVAGVVAAGAAIALLTRDAQHTGLTLDHAMMPVLVFLTVLFGHEAWRALKEVKLLSALFMTALAIFGSGIIVSETMGRRAETRDAKVAQATKTVDQYATIAADYQRTAKLVSEAEGWVGGECRTGNGPKCQGNRFVLAQRTASLEKLRGQLETATAPAPIDSKADRVAAVLALFGVSAEMAKKAFQTFDPFTLSLFLELGAVAGFGMGVRTRKVSIPVSESVLPVSEPRALTFERPLTDDEVEQIRKLLEGRSAPVTNDELAALAGVTKSEMSKRVAKAEAAGQVVKFRRGRFNAISLVA